MAIFAESRMRQYDKNGDGVLKGDELEGVRSAKEIDKDGDGTITKEEFLARLTSYSQSRGGDDRSSSSSRSDGSSSGSTRSDSSRSDSSRSNSSSNSSTANSDRKTYRAKTPAERLPKEMPSWFARTDANGDGQIAMPEFTTSWSDAKVAEFSRYDINGDGYITAQECLKAEGKPAGGTAGRPSSGDNASR
jgi:Ca2+-binding EF-hand superfamily protein